MTTPIMRRANVDDLPAIVSLLADDALGSTREDSSLPLRNCYVEAFNAIDADPNQFLAVAVVDQKIVGTLQLTYLPNISHLGAWRAQIEGVRTHEELRGTGLGRRLFEWAFDQARVRGCTVVQLTCDRARADAHRFYEALGFVPSHTGFKKKL